MTTNNATTYGWTHACFGTSRWLQMGAACPVCHAWVNGITGALVVTVGAGSTNGGVP